MEEEELFFCRCSYLFDSNSTGLELAGFLNSVSCFLLEFVLFEACSDRLLTGIPEGRLKVTDIMIFLNVF